MPKKKNYRETLASYNVHMKDGREKFLNDVAMWYTKMYPNRADFFKRSLKNLKQVSTDGYQAGKSGHMYCSMRVPQELLLFIQQWVPDFGRDSADMELLCKVWSDLVPVKDSRRRTRLLVRSSDEPIPPSPNHPETQESTEEGPPTCEHGTKAWLVCTACIRQRQAAVQGGTGLDHPDREEPCRGPSQVPQEPVR